jgi:parallel beta-helix repeat protein
MSSSVNVLAAVGLATAGIVLLAGAQNPPDRLAGARAVIDASQYGSLQAALDAVPPEGGLVRLPPGEFEIDQPLIIRTGDTKLEGSGSATHIKNVNRSGQPALILEKPTGQKDKLWRIHLSDFRITGNDSSGHGIEARAINEILIEGVSVSYHGGDGIRLDHCYEDPRVCHSLLTYNKQSGLNLLGCHDIVVCGNQFEENNDALRCIDGFNLCMTGNCLDDHLGHGVVIENTYGSVVSGNMIEECKGTAVILDRNCYGNTVSANVIAHNGRGIELRDAHGCAVSANTFTIMVGEALRIDAGSGRITATGNNFSNSYVGDGKVVRGQQQLMAGGVVLSQASDVAFAGNLLSGLNPTGLAAADGPSHRVVVSGNLLRNVSVELKALHDSLVEGNLHRGERVVEGKE